jgi:alpha-acetolactate decarboxylase
MQYIAAGFPNPLPIGGLWCEICQKLGHDPYHFPMMKKYQIVPKSSYCNFFKLVGHDHKDCRTLNLMREITSYAYRVQEEMMTDKVAPQFNQVTTSYNIVQQQYNTRKPQYNTTQPHYNHTHHEEIKLDT